MNIIFISFITSITLLILHEMDAIKAKEWRMFIILKDMNEEIAYKVFSIIHFPLYFVILFLMLQFKQSTNSLFFIIIDILLILHTFIHLGFRKNKSNGFSSMYSKILMYLLGLSALINLLILKTS